MSTINLFDLTGKTALVTGCNRGIGKAMAEALAEAGSDIIGVSSSNIESAGDLQASVAKTGRNFYPYQADLGNRERIYAFIEMVKKEHDRIDILINNAGIILRQPAAEHVRVLQKPRVLGCGKRYLKVTLKA